jgi:flotillin
MKTHEGAANKAKVDVAEAKYKGDVGAKKCEGLTRQETSKIESETVIVENEHKVQVAEAEMNLATKKSEYDKQTKIASIEASQAANMRESELQKEVEERRLLSETARLRAQHVSKATAEFEATKAIENAKLYTLQKKAEGDLCLKQKEAEGDLVLYNAQAEGIRKMLEAFGGDSQRLLFGILVMVIQLEKVP